MYKFRWANKEDLPVILNYWVRMAKEMGRIDGIPIPDKERVKKINNFFHKEFDTKQLVFRIAVDEKNSVVSCAGGLLRDEFAAPLSEITNKFGWIINVYTVNEHRKNGLASSLVEDVCEWLKENGAERAKLWSSSNARKVYQNLGFQSSLDMVKIL